MAMGSRGRREAENAIAFCRPFKNSTGSFYGTRGSTRTLGWLEQHAEAHRIRELLSRAVYVVWSYGTPISFVSETEDGERTAYYVDQSHSRTTSHHQSTARVGMGEYETIGERRPVRRRRPVRPVNQVALDRANATVQGYAEAARREPTAAHVYNSAARTETPQSSVQPVSRTTFNQYDTDSPEFIAPDQETQRERLAALLDPRFANPDWTPWGRFGGLPEGADERDEARVEREGTWAP
jgi:hypothetical protein